MYGICRHHPNPRDARHDLSVANNTAIVTHASHPRLTDLCLVCKNTPFYHRRSKERPCVQRVRAKGDEQDHSARSRWPSHICPLEYRYTAVVDNKKWPKKMNASWSETEGGVVLSTINIRWVGGSKKLDLILEVKFWRGVRARVHRSHKPRRARGFLRLAPNIPLASVGAASSLAFFPA